MKNLLPPRIKSLIVLPLVWAATAQAALNDIFPADFVAPAEGKTAVATYLYDTDLNGTWNKGIHQGNLTVNQQAAALRISHVYQVGDTKIAPVTVMSGGSVDATGTLPKTVSRHASGYGDLRLGVSTWAIDDVEHRHYLGINLMTTWPTGRYDSNELLNTGENRHHVGLTVGWIKGLGNRWTMELFPEIAWHGPIDRRYPGASRLEQSRTESLTGYLRYRITPELDGFVGFQANEGGETSVNGVAQHNPIHSRREYVGSTWTLDKANRLNFRYGRDESVYTGLKVSQELAARWLRIF